MNTAIDCLITLLKCELTGVRTSVEVPDRGLENVYALSEHHDLSHIIYKALQDESLLPGGELESKFKLKYDLEINWYLRRVMAIDLVRKSLENAGIPFIFLKGAVISELYPEPWMRNSSDIDVLVKQGSLENAINILTDAGLTRVSRSTHDVLLKTPDETKIELHYTLIEEYRYPKPTEILQRVWELSFLKDGASFEYSMSDPMFYYYHIAHMVKHFENGGCGIRSIMDTWLLDHFSGADHEGRKKLLEEGGLAVFSGYASGLADVWFSDKKRDGSLDDFEKYVIEGGVYGTVEKMIAVKRTKDRSRFKYYLTRLFQPYSKMKLKHPLLQKIPVLLPFYWGKYVFKAFKKEKRKTIADEMAVERLVDKEESRKIKSLMEKLEIWHQ